MLLEIKTATEEDVVDILCLLQSHVEHRFWKDTLPFETNTAFNGVMEQINNPNVYFAIAYVDDLPEGLMYAVSSPMIWNASRFAYAPVWYVNPDIRGLGIGWKLAECMKDWARSIGCTKILLGSTLDGTGEPKNGLTPSEQVYVGNL